MPFDEVEVAGRRSMQPHPFKCLSQRKRVGITKLTKTEVGMPSPRRGDFLNRPHLPAIFSDLTVGKSKISCSGWKVFGGGIFVGGKLPRVTVHHKEI